MSASQKINNVLSKGFEVVGKAEQVAGLLGTSLFGKSEKKFIGPADKIYQEFKSQEILKNNLGFVQIVLPSSHNFCTRYSLPYTLDFVNYRTDSFSIPGLGLATSDVKRYGYGPNERKPYAPIYTDVNFSFIADKDAKIHKFFYLWMNGIVNHHKPSSMNAQDPFAENALPYEVEYKDSYKCNIVIYSYNEDGRVAQEVVIQDAYPVFLGDIQYSWADTDSLIRIPVTFTYYNWSIRDVEFGITDARSTPNTSKSGLGTLGKIVKTASAIQTLASLKRPQNISDIINVVSNTKQAIGKLPI